MTTATQIIAQCIADGEVLALVSSQPVTLPPLPLSAQINLENAARLRAAERQQRYIPIILGGSIEHYADFATLCEHCGAQAGLPYSVRYTRRTVHICADCLAQERQYAAALCAALPYLKHTTPKRRRIPAYQPEQE
jgi:hypothetical protein